MKHNDGKKALLPRGHKSWEAVDLLIRRQKTGHVLFYDEFWINRVQFRFMSPNLEFSGHADLTPGGSPRLYFTEVVVRPTAGDEFSAHSGMMRAFVHCLFAFFRRQYAGVTFRTFVVGLLSVSGEYFPRLFGELLVAGEIGNEFDRPDWLEVASSDRPVWEGLNAEAVNGALLNGMIGSVQHLMSRPHSEREVAILLFCSIDHMASISLSPDESEVKSWHFFDWCQRYLRMSRERGVVSPEDLWRARCSYVHTYGGMKARKSAMNYGLIASSKHDVDVYVGREDTLMILVLKGFAVRLMEAQIEFLTHAATSSSLRQNVNIRLGELPLAFPTDSILT